MDDEKRLIKAVEEAGWRVEQGRDGAWKAYSPDGKTIVRIHATNSDRRWLENALSDLRRGGFDVETFKGRRRKK